MDYINLEKNTLVVTKEPLAGYTLINIFHLFVQNKFLLGFRYLPRVFYSLFMSTVMTPFRLIERMRFDKDVEKIEVKKDPVFILGHWRSGTTYLHNLMSKDKNLGFFTTFHAYLPCVFLSSEKVFRPILVSSLPEKRPMDDVAMGADLPQENEYSMGAVLPYAYYNGWCFPRNMKFYNSFVCMQDVPEETVNRWKEMYMYMVKKVTLYWRGKQLVLKNPADTGRVKLLLEMFPDAKFVHIYRNPYHVYLSMMRFMRIVIPLYCLQVPPSLKEVEETMMDLYAEMHKKYLMERGLVPEGNLVEVRYEDFIRHPLREVKRVYDSLGLDGFKQSEESFRDFVKSQAGVKTRNYVVDEELREKINKRWGFAIKAFGYED
ncbi:MAG TPA: sulfotransferase [Thermoplasmatales archaeon]|nr:sulfotransferase [Thermoplasmatales archaeon]